MFKVFMKKSEFVVRINHVNGTHREVTVHATSTKDAIKAVQLANNVSPNQCELLSFGGAK